MEATASIAGTALEQATWFRRGLQIRSTAAPTASTTDMVSSSSLYQSDLLPAASESAMGEVGSTGNTPPMLNGSQEFPTLTG